MSGCKLTSKITKDNCQYSVAGVKAIYLFNYDSENKCTLDADGAVETITLADNTLKAYKIDFVDNTASFSDELAVNGNGGKYRTHTVNFTIDNYNYALLNQGDALSLGRFTVVVVDKSNRAIILGRNNGLAATAFNYASGAAEADATGWTVTMAGTEIEIARLLASESVVTAITE
ncbi:hypothetical protein [Dysgonomonas sp. 511]|uniref:hypothetical protein n=1 Tax=Dysgonomonas sp. 511 TaxID=2302930 RepID=UPI0013CFBC6C|nr:hypothetical protein [Dysgonomonas sp. 511]NDV79762.1 hypothetical protein [Dysgonomonas sp. 511]